MPAEPIDNDLGTALPGGQADAPKIPTSPDPGAQQIPEDLSGGSLADADVALPTAGEALDALHEEALKEEANKAAEIVKDPPKPKPKPKPPAAEEGVGDGSEPDPDPKDATEDDVESLTFPENSSSKAREQFEKLKTLSRERVQAAETIAKKADEELKALKSKLEGSLQMRSRNLWRPLRRSSPSFESSGLMSTSRLLPSFRRSISAFRAILIQSSKNLRNGV